MNNENNHGPGFCLPPNGGIQSLPGLVEKGASLFTGKFFTVLADIFLSATGGDEGEQFLRKKK